MTASHAEIEVTIADAPEMIALVEKFKALIDALKAMKMTCHNCGEKQTLSLGVTDAIAALEAK